MMEAIPQYPIPGDPIPSVRMHAKLRLLLRGCLVSRIWNQSGETLKKVIIQALEKI